ARRRPDRIPNTSLVGRRVEKQGLFQLVGQPGEEVEGNYLAADLAHGVGLNVAQRVLAVKQAEPLQFQGRDAQGVIRDAELVPDDVMTTLAIFRGGGQIGTKLRTQGHRWSSSRSNCRRRALSYSWVRKRDGSRG